MRVRSERYDGALTALKKDHQVHIDELTAAFQRDAEAEAQRHHADILRERDEAADRLENAVEEMRRSKNEELAHAIEGIRADLDEAHNSRLASVMNQQQEMHQGVVERHQAELRSRMALVAQQKDELHHADKQLALKDAQSTFEKIMNQRVLDAEDRMREELAHELESVRRECARTIQALETQVGSFSGCLFLNLTIFFVWFAMMPLCLARPPQHKEERQRLSVDMLDQREETRSITAKSQEEKAIRREAKLRQDLAVVHATEREELRQEFDAELVSFNRQTFCVWESLPIPSCITVPLFVFLFFGKLSQRTFQARCTSEQQAALVAQAVGHDEEAGCLVFLRSAWFHFLQLFCFYLGSTERVCSNYCFS